MLNAQLVQILDRLSSLPGRRELSVETKRYPRFLPAENGVGFQHKFWSFNGSEKPAQMDIDLPPDAEDVVVTWKGAVKAAETMGEITTLMGAAVMDQAFRSSWDYEVFTRQREPGVPQVVVRVFRHFGMGSFD
jgi:hypothetical protein